MPLYAGKYAICAFLQNMRNMLRSNDRYKPQQLWLIRRLIESGWLFVALTARRTWQCIGWRSAAFASIRSLTVGSTRRSVRRSASRVGSATLRSLVGVSIVIVVTTRPCLITASSHPLMPPPPPLQLSAMIASVISTPHKYLQNSRLYTC